MIDWKKLLLYPVAVWVVIYLFICVLVGLKINANANWVMVVTTLISLVGLFIASRAAKVDGIGKALVLGIAWVLVMVILDFILTKPFVAGYFGSWKTYFNYGITFLMPVIFARK